MSEAGVARVGDICTGICAGHTPPVAFTATFTQGSSKFSADGVPVVLVGHLGIADCGHGIVATTGSSITTVGGVAVVRSGDAVVMVGPTGGGTVIGGSSNVKTL